MTTDTATANDRVIITGRGTHSAEYLVTMRRPDPNHPRGHWNVICWDYEDGERVPCAYAMLRTAKRKATELAARHPSFTYEVIAL